MILKEPEHSLVTQLAGQDLTVSAGPALKGKYESPFCPGCGHGIIGACVNKVLLKRDDLLSYPLITGVGCCTLLRHILAGRCIYIIHGRAFPFATGVKLANPRLKPIVFSGDGDCLAIGIGHFMHAARRNVDMVVVLLNNQVYGMTGGQMGPTTAKGAKTSTTPLGMMEASFDPVQVAITAGATYVARWTVAQPFQIMKSLDKALDHRGFSVIDIISICPTYRGRLNSMTEPVAMLRWLKGNTIPMKEAEGKNEDELRGKHVVGEFLERGDKPELSQQYEELISRARLGK